jgi:hypothetical protein
MPVLVTHNHMLSYWTEMLDISEWMNMEPVGIA